MPTLEQINDLLARLAAVPQTIASIFGERSDAELTAQRDGEWSGTEVLAHLRAADDILGYRAYAILVRDDAPLPAFDERRWAEVVGYAALPLRETLAVYAGKRGELTAMLRRATPEQWDRTCVHETRGAVTLWDQVTTLVEHEEEHLAQLRTLLG
jgi:hypothetical protein